MQVQSHWSFCIKMNWMSTVEVCQVSPQRQGWVHVQVMRMIRTTAVMMLGDLTCEQPSTGWTDALHHMDQCSFSSALSTSIWVSRFWPFLIGYPWSVCAAQQCCCGRRGTCISRKINISLLFDTILKVMIVFALFNLVILGWLLRGLLKWMDEFAVLWCLNYYCLWWCSIATAAGASGDQQTFPGCSTAVIKRY